MVRKKGFAYCGLACCLCAQNKQCAGCKSGQCTDQDWGKNYKCCREQGLDGCYLCDDFPCSDSMLDKLRIRTFSKYIALYGEEALLDCLERNERAGIVYHYENSIQGDYDQFDSEEESINFILHGKSSSGSSV